MRNHKFKIGDRVRVNKPSNRRHGETGEVSGYEDYFCLVQLDSEKGRGQRGYLDRHLEPETSQNEQDLKLLSDLFETCNCLQHGTPKGCASWCNTQPIRKVSQ